MAQRKRNLLNSFYAAQHNASLHGCLIVNIVRVILKFANLKDVSSLSVIDRRANLKTGVSRKQGTPNFPKNEHFLPADTCTRTFAYQALRNVRFSENLACFVFLKHLFWVLPFCLITSELIYSDKTFKLQELIEKDGSVSIRQKKHSGGRGRNDRSWQSSSVTCYYHRWELSLVVKAYLT